MHLDQSGRSSSRSITAITRNIYLCDIARYTTFARDNRTKCDKMFAEVLSLLSRTFNARHYVNLGGIPDAMPTLTAVEVLLTDRRIVVHPGHMSRRVATSTTHVLYAMHTADVSSMSISFSSSFPLSPRDDRAEITNPQSASFFEPRSQFFLDPSSPRIV